MSRLRFFLAAALSSGWDYQPALRYAIERSNQLLVKGFK